MPSSPTSKNRASPNKLVRRGPAAQLPQRRQRRSRNFPTGRLTNDAHRTDSSASTHRSPVGETPRAVSDSDRTTDRGAPCAPRLPVWPVGDQPRTACSAKPGRSQLTPDSDCARPPESLRPKIRPYASMPVERIVTVFPNTCCPTNCLAREPNACFLSGASMPAKRTRLGWPSPMTSIVSPSTIRITFAPEILRKTRKHRGNYRNRQRH